MENHHRSNKKYTFNILDLQIILQIWLHIPFKLSMDGGSSSIKAGACEPNSFNVSFLNISSLTTLHICIGIPTIKNGTNIYERSVWTLIFFFNLGMFHEIIFVPNFCESKSEILPKNDKQILQKISEKYFLA